MQSDTVSFLSSLVSEHATCASNAQSQKEAAREKMPSSVFFPLNLRLSCFSSLALYQEDPTKETLLQNVLDRHNPKSADHNPGPYIKGVVNQEIKGLTGKATNLTPAKLFKDGHSAPQSVPIDALTPANVKTKFHDFAADPLRASMVMVHSKVVVIDPFGKYPVVMTGSHNLGLKASQKNDDNLVFLEGPTAGPLAAAYALNIIAIYQTYRWNTYVTEHQKDSKVWHGLQDTDSWQNDYLAGANLAELDFWMAESLAKATVVAAAPAGHQTAAPHSTSHRARKAQQALAVLRGKACGSFSSGGPSTHSKSFSMATLRPGSTSK